MLDIWNMWYKIKQFPREVKYFWQRGRRGYSDIDRWNIAPYLASWLPEALAEVRTKGMSYPPEFNHEDEWHSILEEIEWALIAVRHIYAYDGSEQWTYLPNWNAETYAMIFRRTETWNLKYGTEYGYQYIMTYGECKRMENGLALLGKHLWEMWD
jgi:hypothetical protein